MLWGHLLKLLHNLSCAQIYANNVVHNNLWLIEYRSHVIIPAIARRLLALTGVQVLLTASQVPELVCPPLK